MRPQPHPNSPLTTVDRGLWGPPEVEVGCWPAYLVVNGFLSTPYEFILIDFYFLGFWINHPLGMGE